jgi:hypothetical protein
VSALPTHIPTNTLTPVRVVDTAGMVHAMKQAVEAFNASWECGGLSTPEYNAMNGLKAAIKRETGEQFINKVWVVR